MSQWFPYEARFSMQAVYYISWLYFCFIFLSVFLNTKLFGRYIPVAKVAKIRKAVQSSTLVGQDLFMSFFMIVLNIIKRNHSIFDLPTARKSRLANLHLQVLFSLLSPLLKLPVGCSMSSSFPVGGLAAVLVRFSTGVIEGGCVRFLQLLRLPNAITHEVTSIILLNISVLVVSFGFFFMKNVTGK